MLAILCITGESNWYNHLGRTLMIYNIGLKNGCIFGPVIPILGIHSKEILNVNTDVNLT